MKAKVCAGVIRCRFFFGEANKKPTTKVVELLQGMQEIRDIHWTHELGGARAIFLGPRRLLLPRVRIPSWVKGFPRPGSCVFASSTDWILQMGPVRDC